MIYYVIVLGTLIFNSFFVHAGSQAQKCNINDPDVSNCVFEALNSLRSQTRRQSKEIQSPSSEAFTVPIFHIIQESTAANYTATVTNHVTRGLDNFDLKYVRFNPETLTFHGQVEYSPLSMTGNYEIAGHLASIPVIGKGSAHAALGPINATVKVNGVIVKHNGVDHYNLTGLQIKMIIGEMDMYLDGIFGENRELARVTNEALSANANLIANAVTPAFEKIGEKVFLKSMKSIATKILHVK